MADTVPFFERYTRLVQETDVVAAMRDQLVEMLTVFARIPLDQADVVHAPYAWTVKQVIGHMIDTERVFGYRAMRFARGDATPLPGFDQDAYVANADFASRALADLSAEFEHLRRSHIQLFASFSPPVWARVGTASNLQWRVEDLARAIVGHARHHTRILQSRLGMD